MNSDSIIWLVVFNKKEKINMKINILKAEEGLILKAEEGLASRRAVIQADSDSDSGSNSDFGPDFGAEDNSSTPDNHPITPRYNTRIIETIARIITDCIGDKVGGGRDVTGIVLDYLDVTGAVADYLDSDDAISYADLS